MEPWETPEGKSIWKSSSAFFQWLRGAMRRIWADNPGRKEWKKNQLRPVTQRERDAKLFHPSTKNVGQCYLCQEYFPGSKLEVDHNIASEGCKSWEEAHKFLEYCARTTGEDWSLACKPCHKVKTYAERYGYSFEQALVKKRVITLMKASAAHQYKELMGMGFNSSEIKTEKDRKKAYTQLVEEGKIG